MIDDQVCNHNYLLADALRHTDEQRPLIPNYQSIIIDETHKLDAFQWLEVLESQGEGTITYMEDKNLY